MVGIRSNHLYLKSQNENNIELDTIVELLEINGSETFIHVNYEATKLVVQEVGVYSRKLDSKIRVYLDPANLFVFSASGSLLLSPDNTPC
jgi:glycerol transport system ATP-binding protein